jgi:NDP-sugar pyrophosphorylase family protein
VGEAAPKHLLPLPVERGGPATILESVVEAGLLAFRRARVHVREEAASSIGEALGGFGDRVQLAIDRELTGPFGPIARLLRPGQTLYFAGGDAFCDWRWDDLVAYHESHDLPVTAFVARTLTGPGGARVDVAQTGATAAVTRWQRVDSTGPDDLVNIGAYCIDGTPETISLLASLERHTEDGFLGGLARQGLLAAFVSPELGFNVNTQEVYDALVRTLDAAVR